MIFIYGFLWFSLENEGQNIENGGWTTFKDTMGSSDYSNEPFLVEFISVIFKKLNDEEWHDIIKLNGSSQKYFFHFRTLFL